MVRSTFYAFETAKKALSASQYGLDTVGHNISNINTQGYTRQRVDQVSISLNGTRAKYAIYGRGNTLAGQGSEVIGINQIRDPYLDKRYRVECATAGELNAISNDLADINKIFDEIMTTGSHAKMSEFLAQLEKLIAAADSKEQASVLRNYAEQICSILNQNSTSLDYVEDQVLSELGYVVEDVNSILSQIAMLNTKIKDEHFYGNPANELMDQRNLLIDQLSEYMDINVETYPMEISKGDSIEQVRITIRNSGNTNKGVDPIVLVDSGTFYGIKMVQDENSGEVSIRYTDGGSEMEIQLYHADGSKSSDITSYLFTGTIKGHLNILNGNGTYASNGENAFRGIPYYRQVLNDYAATLADSMNKLNELEVYGPNGPYLDANGNPVTIARDLFTSKDGEPINASNICVTNEWKKNPQYIENAKTNNALFVDENGFVCFPDGDNDPKKTGIEISQIAFIDHDGFILDENGNMLNERGIPTNNQDEAVTLDMLQRAMTEATTFHPFDWDDYTYDLDDNGNIHPNNGDVAIKAGNGHTNAIVQAHGSYTFPDDVHIKDDGIYYWNDDTPVAVNYTIDGVATNGGKLTKDMLYKLTTGGTGVDYTPGDPTPNELLPGASASDNLMSMLIMLRDTEIRFDNGFTGTFQEYLVNMQSEMALDKELNDATLDASLTVLLGIADNRDAISGVSIDEEGISMMTYQNYYNAAARYMTVLDEALGTVIQSMGVVGR